MFYYEVAPGERNYQGREFLTYCSKNELKIGQIVVVKVRTLSTSAFVIKAVNKPSFAVKEVTKSYELYIPKQLVNLFLWICEYYPAGVGSIASMFVPALPKKDSTIDQKNDVVNTSKKSSDLKPTTKQHEIIERILSSSIGTHVLHGDTGTGKTLIYRKLVEATLKQNRSAIVLTPEISLTPQLAEQFNNHFDNVFVVHSGLTTAQRRTIWLSVARATEPVILIGPRSALFYPIKELGIIIIDEFHDSAYKQDQSPRYNALRVAGYLSKNSGSKLVMGSATPPIEDYFYAEQKGATIHRLTEHPSGKKNVNTINIVNLSDKNELSKYPLLSQKLLDLIDSNLKQNLQSLIFLNKRGTSRLMVCQNCGWHAVCERCNIPYTYHHDRHVLLCHTCGNKESAPNNCPVCSSEQILFKNPGTKAIEESLQKIFPQAKIGRYDKDNKKIESFTTNHSSISAGNVDILVGTQILTKGHDLPKLGLVGILFAESSLQFPDFSSKEKSFQLLHQIAGRVGRHDHPGSVVVQTYMPSERLLQIVKHADNDWINFHTTELQQRKKYKFPPFCFLLKIEVARKTEKSAENFIHKIHQLIMQQNIPEIEVLGPSPCFIYKQNDRYQWQIIIKSSRRTSLIGIVKSLPASCTYNIDPSNLL